MSRKRQKLQVPSRRSLSPAVPSEPEKAQIDIEGGDDLYREIRIET